MKPVILKDCVKCDEILRMNPLLWQMFAYVVAFCAENNINMVVSSIYRPPNDGISSSTTHQEYRAFDLSLKGWDKKLIDKLESEIESHYKPYGAISAKSGESRPIVIHDVGTGIHAHFQVRRI